MSTKLSQRDDKNPNLLIFAMQRPCDNNVRHTVLQPAYGSTYWPYVFGFSYKRYVSSYRFDQAEISELTGVIKASRIPTNRTMGNLIFPIH